MTPHAGAKHSRFPGPEQRRVPLFALILFLVLPCSVALGAATPKADYQARVSAAAQIAQEAAAQKNAAAADIFERLTRLLPAKEDIVDEAETVHVNNTWLHEQLANLDNNDDQDSDLRARQWQDLAAYLAALNQRVNGLEQSPPTAAKLDRATLDNILARPEYQTDTREASTIQQWLKKMWQRLIALLARLFGANDVPDLAKPGQKTVSVARIIIISLLALALAFVLFKVFQWWQRRLPQAKDESVREILGVELTEETTTEDLLAAARALARQGDYRGAIRRAYLALLYELEQRGKLRLHRAKTNRDYLNAVRHEAELYTAFVALTRHFEQIWYGQASATDTEFENFLDGYQQALK